MISEVLREIGERLTDFRGVLLIGSDGLVVDKFGVADPETESIVIELLAAVRKLESNLGAKQQKPLRTIAISGDTSNYLLYSVVDSYYLFLAFGNRTHQGQCRYELKKASMDLAKELS